MIRTSADIFLDIQAINPDARVARARRLAFLERIAAWEVAMTQGLVAFGGGSVPEQSGTSGMEQSPLIASLTGGRECVRLIEASEVWPIVTDRLDPLHDELDAALAREREAAAAAQAAKTALEEARAAALAKAEAAADKDPKVIAARRALEAIAPTTAEPAAPVAKEAAPPAVEAELASDELELATADPLKGDVHD